MADESCRATFRRNQNETFHSSCCGYFNGVATHCCSACRFTKPLPWALDGNRRDGSQLTLSFHEQNKSGGRVYEIRGHDDVCSGCGGAPADMEGIGVLEDENTINASSVWWSVPTGDPVFYFLSGYFTYDPDTDTVTDPDGIVYQRGN